MNTPEGAKKAAETTAAKYGKDFWKKIGAKGGSFRGCKGFALDVEKAREAGRKGGTISRRGPAKANTVTEEDLEYIARV